MAYYCEVMDLTRPRPSVLMVHYNLIDEDTKQILESGTHGFTVRDGETLEQVTQRLQAETDSYFDSLVMGTQGTEDAFQHLRSIAVGYRYPAG